MTTPKGCKNCEYLAWRIDTVDDFPYEKNPVCLHHDRKWIFTWTDPHWRMKGILFKKAVCPQFEPSETWKTKLQDFWHGISRRVKQFFRNIHRVLYWLPIIWKDRYWDWSFLFTIIKHKMEYNAERFEKHGMHVGSKEDARKMRICCILLDRIIKQDYCVGRYEAPTKWWKGPTEYKSYMTNQDVQLFTKILNKHFRGWWD